MFHAALLLFLAPQTTWFVDSSQPGPGTGTQADPYSRIDFGVAQATTQSGDTFVIAGGVYSNEKISYSSRSLTFEAATGAQPVLEGPDDGPIFRLQEGRLVATGLRLEGGTGTPVTFNGVPQLWGGAIFAYNANVVLTQCSIADATATLGGAIYTSSSSGGRNLRLTNVEIEPSNRAVVHGGGIYADNVETRIESSVLHGVTLFGAGGALYLNHDGDRLAEINDTLVSGLAEGDGGGIFATGGGSVSMEGSTVQGAATFDGMGGGVYLNFVPLSAVDCLFQGNLATDGGAIFAHDVQASLDLLRCTFRSNRARSQGQSMGGAIHAVAGGTALQCIFRRNEAESSGRGVGGATFGRMVHERCTFDGNGAELDGGAVAALASQGALTGGAVRGCIVIDGIQSALPPLSAEVLAEFNLSNAPIPGTGNEVGDPAFWFGSGEYFLRPPSSARDFLPPSFGLDPDGSRREAGAQPFDPEYCGFNCDGALGSVNCVATPNSTGVPSVISGLGSQVSAVNLVILNVNALPSGAIGYFIGSRASGFVPGAGGSSGNLCVGGTVQRFDSTILQSPPAGDSVSFQPDLRHLPVGGGIHPGDVFLFQFWHRDMNAAGATSNFSPSLRVAF